MVNKYLIFDSSSLINLVSNGLVEVLRELKKLFDGEFIIPESVKYETIDHPITINRFEWGAVRIKQLLNEGTLKLANEFFDTKETKKTMNEVLNMTNNSFFQSQKAIHLIDEGEAECLALGLACKKRGEECLIVIDERTARMLCESSLNLHKVLESKLHLSIKFSQKNTFALESLKIIRSTELAYFAYKNNIIKIKEKNVLEAVLYALKFGGCSISEKEIQLLKRG